MTILAGESAIKECSNIVATNCSFEGNYPFWHVHGLKLENCTFDAACDRAFEYSTLEADIRGAIANIKNPISGHIVADSIGSVTIDENIKAPADCIIEERKG